MIYLDANVLVAAVVRVDDEDRTAQVRKLLQGKPVLQVSPLAEYEARKHLHQSGEADWAENISYFLSGPARLLADQWSAPISQALRIARDFNERLVVDSADTLHVAWAVSIGADVFASFDRRSGPRALALCLGMKVWPVATRKDYEQMKRLKG